MTEPPPPSQFNTVEDGQVVRTAAEEVRRWASWSNRIEVILVGLAALALVVLAVQNNANSGRVKQLVEAQVKGQQFGIDAVNCIRYLIIEHRFVNEEYHREQAVKFGLTPPPHPALGRRPTQDEIMQACKAFEGNPQPPQVSSTTRKGER